ncbi:MAG TPA: porin [Gallionella sp.]|nr:porin [Gallionella sp.]
MQGTFAKQKRLIVVALAAATFAAPALADTGNVSVYGKADLSYDFINTGTSAAGVAGTSKGNVSSNVSKLGFKGAEGIGDGLSAIWQVEGQVNIDNVGGTFATRNSFLGLKSDSGGTVLLGRHDTPYKLATRKLDIFGDSIADNRALLGGVTSNTTVDSASAAFDGRQPDIVMYTSPDMNGFVGMIAYANLKEANTTAAQVKDNLTSLAATYKAGPLYGSIGYENHKLDSVLAGGKESAWKLGLGYTLNAFTTNFVYEKTDDNLTVGTGANRYGHNAYYLAGNYKMGMNAVKLAYGKAGQHGATANTGASQFSLGYDHGLSKRTKLYAIYSRINNNSASDYGFSQSAAAAGTINGIGSSPSVVSIGMQHNF